MLDKVLVTGGSGFIGSRLMKRHTEWDNIDLKSGLDLFDTYNFDYDAIVLLAASLKNTVSAYHYNLHIYEALIRAALCEREPYILYISSAAVYAPALAGSSYESEYLNPATLYGKSKLLGEQIVQDVFSRCTILRLSNVYGDGDGHGVIDRFKLGERTIYGDGSQVRDYIYVNKVVQAIERVMASPDRYEGETYNISSGYGQTVDEIFKKYAKGEPIYAPAREGDVAYSVLNNTAAKEEGLL